MTALHRRRRQLSSHPRSAQQWNRINQLPLTNGRHESYSDQGWGCHGDASLCICSLGVVNVISPIKNSTPKRIALPSDAQRTRWEIQRWVVVVVTTPIIMNQLRRGGQRDIAEKTTWTLQNGVSNKETRETGLHYLNANGALLHIKSNNCLNAPKTSLSKCNGGDFWLVKKSKKRTRKFAKCSKSHFWWYFFQSEGGGLLFHVVYL